jgi:hypothetical protein
MKNTAISAINTAANDSNTTSVGPAPYAKARLRRRLQKMASDQQRIRTGKVLSHQEAVKLAMERTG